MTAPLRREEETAATMEEVQIERARRGDPAAIDWLLERYRHRVLRLATHVLRRPSEAEDVAQEAFVRAFRRLSDYRGDGQFYTWLYQIVVRVCLDRRRSARWQREAPIETAAELVATDGYRDADGRLLVEALLDQLAPPMRAILVLRELEGLEYAEIAEILEMPVGRVRWRLHTARAKFQALWRQAQQETDDV